MSYNSDQLLKMANDYEISLLSNAAPKSSDKKKPDAKAAVRNRGKVALPAEHKKVSDQKDHYPANTVEQARNALAQVAKYTKAPPWFSGTLTELQNTVKSFVHKHYPSIDKKSSTENLINKYANDARAFYELVRQYDTGSQPLTDFAEAMKISAQEFAKENNLDELANRKIYEILLKQAELCFSMLPEMEALDREMSGVGFDVPGEDEPV